MDFFGYIEETCRSFECLKFDYDTDPDKRAQLWKARHNVWYAAQALRPGSKVSVVTSP
jgi:D-lactate dehydrogenase (cytochrome)